MMDFPDHLSFLKQNGVEAWNNWRFSESTRPQLEGADLSNLKLGGIDFRDANLVDANLSGADLYGASFNKANLYRAVLKNAMLAESSFDSANLHHCDLSEAMLDQAQFVQTYLSGANFYRASLRNAILREANLSRNDAINLPGASLERADLEGANLEAANLIGANLQDANLTSANFYCAALAQANLRGANLTRANLQLATFIGTNLEGANLSECHVYGLAAWDVNLDGAKQTNLLITPKDSATITVDNLEVAQFLYLLLNNRNIRDVIDTITSKVVLILGRFTEERIAILDALRTELRGKGYLPVLFDFDKPASRDLTETVSTIAHMARFVIADITDARSIPQELMAIVPNLPSVPVQPLLLASQREYAMFDFFRRFPWVLEPYHYDDQESLLASLDEKVIAPAEAKAKEQQPK